MCLAEEENVIIIITSFTSILYRVNFYFFHSFLFLILVIENCYHVVVVVYE